MSLKSSLQNLQNRPVDSRVRIMWSTAAVIAVVLLVTWAYTTTQQVKTTDTSDLKLPDDTTASYVNSSETKYVSVEWVEWNGSGNAKIFFKISNPTDNILNFSKNTDITTTVRDTQVTAVQLTDRQNKPFVQKVLAKTDNFGILIFENVSQKNIDVKFDQMFFENELGIIFSETVKLDLEKLNKTLEIRS